jgi:hypothetical protein
MLHVPAGFRGPMPAWPGFDLETLACGGSATINGEPWHRGCYQFGGPTGLCSVDTDLELYVRAFRRGPVTS